MEKGSFLKSIELIDKEESVDTCRGIDKEESVDTCQCRGMHAAVWQIYDLDCFGLFFQQDKVAQIREMHPLYIEDE